MNPNPRLRRDIRTKNVVTKLSNTRIKPSNTLSTSSFKLRRPLLTGRLGASMGTLPNSTEECDAIEMFLGDWVRKGWLDPARFFIRAAFLSPCQPNSGRETE